MREIVKKLEVRERERMIGGRDRGRWERKGAI